ncbi:auxin-induced in root cultures protein 12-like [Cucurbita pepo subsp. pepo]|uniref:auxin-induced in root cultures protein 12-like n=1 Tax=Cucurbita pepo subsp. pepo TaxID=3664 RepID=UPI000C9D5ACE|nr:auxin-induced in root cultures protein 12-like [Cucurbita pepo subsp. pepo]
MASFSHFILFSAIFGCFLSRAQSLTCSSQSFSNRSFAHCDDLPHLDAFLHWTYDPKNSSLSLAFLASPPHSGGWVSWAVNPTSTGMAGAQAFVASVSGKAPSVRTFNISSYSSVVPSPKLSFLVWGLAAEFSDGRFTIFASVKVPPEAKSLNHVWQVGPEVDPDTGVPSVHEFKPANLNAKSVLVFDKKGGASPAPHALDGESPAPSPAVVGLNEAAASATAPSTDKSGVAGSRSRNFRLVVGWFVFVWGIISF